MGECKFALYYPKGKNMNRNYEMVVLVRQDASASQAQAIIDKMIGFIETSGGKIARNENWGVRNLAYRIENNRKAHYFCLNFNVDGKVPQEIERQLKINEDVVRILITQTEELITEPSVIMSRKDDNAKRGYNNYDEEGE